MDVKVSVVTYFGDVQLLQPHKSIIRLSSRHPLSLPPRNIITPACLASELIYPPSPPQATLALAAPFMRLLLVVFDCLRKLMPAIIFREPKTVMMTLFCSVIASFDHQRVL